MPILDTQAILQGTPSKVIRQAWSVMKENYSDETAYKFYETYKDCDLSTILENSRYIYSDPKYGKDFYLNVMESGCIPFVSYYDEREKLKAHIVNHETEMNDATKKYYETLCESVNNLLQDHRKCLVVETALDEPEDAVMEFTNTAYKYLTKSYENAAIGQAELRSAFEQLSPKARVLYAMERASDLGLELGIMNAMESEYSESASEDMDGFSFNIDLMLMTNLMKEDSKIQESVNTLTNKVLKTTFNGLGSEDVEEVLCEAVVNNTKVVDLTIRSIHSAVNEFFESMMDDDGTEEFEKFDVFDNTLRKYIAYEHVLDYVLAERVFAESDDDPVSDYPLLGIYAIERGYDPSTLTISDAEILMTEAVSELEESLNLLEYTEDGRQSKLMRRHASDLREKKDSGNGKTDKSERWKEGNDESDFAVDEADKVVTTNEKPVRNKQSMSSKIQAKALDADVKAKSAGGAIRRFATTVKQTGKAVLKAPANVVNAVKNLIRDWKDGNDARRKEKILKPGYRKKFWSNFKTVLTYGVSFLINPLLVIVTYMVRVASKEKNKYLRNELAMELQTEIKVCDAKIEDAQSNGNQKEKYQLMRIRDKLEKERVRVIANAKYL